MPPAIGRVVARALEKRPEDRYQTAEELVEDFTIAAEWNPPQFRLRGSQPRVELPAASQSAEEIDEETLVRRRATSDVASGFYACSISR